MTDPITALPAELRCRTRPRLTIHGEEAHWLCETAKLVKETNGAHS